MDAIPSLCASTASCGAAAIGCAFGRPSSPRGNETAGTNGGIVNPATPIAVRARTLTPASRVLKSAVSRRPQSATVPRASPWSVLDRSSFDEPGSVVKRAEEHRDPILGNNTFSLSEEPEEYTDRSRWIPRVSTIAQSRDGSVISSLRPSSPSIFSNGSNVPFFGSRQTITPRNKLVKRSTSHRVLHSGSYSGSSFSTGQNPTFRRPATSHQRSEQLRLQSAQRIFENPSRGLETFEENDSTPHTSKRTSGEASRQYTWQPYFRIKSLRIRGDTSRRSQSVPRVPKLSAISSTSRQSDTFRCVDSQQVQRPVLLKGTEVERYPSSQKPFSHSTTKSLSSHPPLTDTDLKSQPPTERPSTFSTGPQANLGSSFSISDIMSTPSPPWKSKGGSLRRKKGREAMTSSRRVSSAPNEVLQKNAEKNTSKLDAFRRGPPTTQETTQKIPTPSSSQSTRPADIEINMLQGDSSDLASSIMNQNTHSPLESKTGQFSSVTDSSLPFKHHRNSRIPSDRESTVFSSDNEQSRVFSADGDDTDYRSETLFDSIRTDITSHSHTGAKNHHIEHVFRDDSALESVDYDLSNLKENLERTTLSNDYKRHSHITEEDESSATPVQRRYSGGGDTSSPNRPFLSSTNDFPSSPPALPTPTRQPEKYPRVIDLNDEWSADESSDGDDNDEIESSPKTQVIFPNSRLELRRRNRDVQLPERPKSNIFDWSERNPPEKEGHTGSSPRPRTAHVKQSQDRGSRSTSRRGPGSYHIRSQSVPLPPENSNYRFNNTSKLDKWILGGKGVSEDWDGDFEFDEDSDGDRREVYNQDGLEKVSDGVVVPHSIIEKQASVHGQFGQVKELTLLVEELRRLRHSAFLYGILQGQASELWKEAEGIIDLATLDEEEDNLFSPTSPTSTTFDFDAFDDEPHSIPRRRRSSASPQIDSLNEVTGPSKPSPAGSKFSTPTGRPRNESIAKAKNVLENIHQHRSSPLEPLPGTPVSSKKLPFDTTSLRDLVTRAGVVTRALKEIIRRIENPDSLPHTPEKGSERPPDPPFSQIFNQPSPSSPSSSKKSPRVARRKSSSSFLNNSQNNNNDNEFNGHMKVMTVA